jgi:DNA-directed RNA polymerase specialized sigma24 family protein
VALIRVHERLAECTQPLAFHAWARRIVTNVAIDELRRQRRLLPMAEDDDHDEVTAAPPTGTPGFEAAVLDQLNLAEFRALIVRAPISERSVRVVVGRFFDNLPDEVLARNESALSGQQVLPSHVQVTRTKDIARLRSWEALRTFLNIS